MQNKPGSQFIIGNRRLILNWRLWLSQLIFLQIVVLILVEVIHRNAPEYHNGYLETIVDKHKRLDSIPAPRIILAGGSGWAFGINSKLVESDFDIPVVNLGLDENLGSAFITNELIRFAKKGDIVVLSTEYSMTVAGNDSVKNELIYAVPSAAQFLENESVVKRFFADRMISLRNFWNSQRLSIYTRNNFLPNGDFIGHLDLKNSPVPLDSLDSQLDFSSQIKDLNRFLAFASTHGIKVYYVFPVYPEKSFERNYDAIKVVESQMRTMLKAEIIGRPEDAVIDDLYFYDSPYHLNTDGRRIMSQRLIQALEDRLD